MKAEVQFPARNSCLCLALPVTRIDRVLEDRPWEDATSAGVLHNKEGSLIEHMKSGRSWEGG